MRRGLLWLCLLPIGASAQSPMFRGSPAHLGVASGPTPTLRDVVWRFRTQGRILATPAVDGGSVYIASTDGRLYAVDRSSGVERWRYGTRGPITSSPAVASGVVVVGSVDGFVHAVDAETGAPRWRFATRGERRFIAPGIHGAIPRTERMPDPFDVFLSSPTIVGDVVYIGSGDQHVYALDLRTGAKRWEFATGDVIHASPAVVDGTVYIGSWDRNLYALDAATGRERWHYTTGADTVIYNQVGIASSAAVSGGMVFVGGRDGHVHAVDAATGAARWTHDNHGGWTIGSPAVRDGVLYFATSDGRRFKALDAATGALRFELANPAISFSSPTLVGDVAFYGTSDGWVRAVNLRSGESAGGFQTDGSKANLSRWLDSAGVFQTAGMYPDRTLDGMMIGMRTMFTVGSVLSTPVVADGVLYVGSADGTLYAIR